MAFRALLGLVLSVAVAGCGPSAPEPAHADSAHADPVPRSLPTMPLPRLGGATSSLADFAAGRVMVIDMWATWCTACKATSARVERLAKAYAKNRGLLVVGVNVGEKRAKVERFFEGAPPLTTFLDADFAFTDALGARQLPVVLIVDRGGQIVYQGNTLDERALRLVDRLLRS